MAKKDISFIWTHGTQELDSFLIELSKFHSNVSLFMKHESR